MVKSSSVSSPISAITTPPLICRSSGRQRPTYGEPQRWLIAYGPSTKAAKRIGRGCEILDGGDRLHEFARGLEALVKPPIGNTRTLFAHRIGQTIATPSPETRATLLQLFDLRSYVEHMHSPLDALSGDE